MTWAMRIQFEDRARGATCLVVEYPFHCWSCGRPELYGERLDCWKCERMLDRAYRFRELCRQRAAIADFVATWRSLKRPPVSELVGTTLRRELEGVVV